MTNLETNKALALAIGYLPERVEVGGFTQVDLQNLFNYKNGSLYYKKSTKAHQAGDKAAQLHNISGYMRVAVYGKKLREHRLIWLMHFG